MLGKQKTQGELFVEAGRLLELIPSDHILVRVNDVLSLSWIEGEVRHLYSDDKGRPSVPPETVMRLMIAGLLLGIIGDRKLAREAQVNLAIRWFAGYGFYENTPDHSSLTKIRTRWGEELFRKVFLRVLEDCKKAGLLDKGTVHIDSTLIRANVSMESVVTNYIEDVATENEADRAPVAKPERACTTDPDATLARKSDKEKYEPCYKAHIAVDDKCGVIVDVKVTTGKASEQKEIVEQVKRVEENTGTRPERVTADAGYATSENYRRLEEMGVEPFIVPQSERVQGKSIPIRRFKYDGLNKVVKCPGKKKLYRSHRNRQGWLYKSQASDCRKCRLKEKCLAKGRRARQVLIVFGYEELLRARRRNVRRDQEYAEEMIRHKWIVEGRHAEAKNIHGLARAVRRGLEQVSIQVLLTATVMNLKRLGAFVFSIFCLLKSLVGLPRATPDSLSAPGLPFRFPLILPLCFNHNLCNFARYPHFSTAPRSLRYKNLLTHPVF